MMKIDSATTQPGAQPSNPDKAPGELGKDDFMKLLTTQLSQQDPLSPVDNQAFVQQLSQMASVERLANISGSIEQLAMAQASNTSAQMVSFIGKSVETASDTIQVDSGAPAHEFGVQLDDDTAEAEVVIRDEDGEVVRRIELGAREAGDHDVSWDGLDKDGAPVEDGQYTFEVIAKDDDGEDIGSSTFSRREVTGVSFANGFPRLNFADGEQAGLGAVREVND
jgi:flagellar basal-body rod modification protein FlgD